MIASIIMIIMSLITYRIVNGDNSNSATGASKHTSIERADIGYGSNGSDGMPKIPDNEDANADVVEKTHAEISEMLHGAGFEANTIYAREQGEDAIAEINSDSDEKHASAFTWHIDSRNRIWNIYVNDGELIAMLIGSVRADGTAEPNDNVIIAGYQEELPVYSTTTGSIIRMSKEELESHGIECKTGTSVSAEYLESI